MAINLVRGKINDTSLEYINMLDVLKHLQVKINEKLTYLYQYSTFLKENLQLEVDILYFPIETVAYVVAVINSDIESILNATVLSVWDCRVNTDPYREIYILVDFEYPDFTKLESVHCMEYEEYLALVH